MRSTELEDLLNLTLASGSIGKMNANVKRNQAAIEIRITNWKGSGSCIRLKILKI